MLCLLFQGEKYNNNILYCIMALKYSYCRFYINTWENYWVGQNLKFETAERSITGMTGNESLIKSY